MGWLSSLILALMAFVFYRKDGKLYSPAVLFSALWSVLCLLSSMQLYGLYGVSDFAFACILLGVIGFAFGCLLADRLKFRNRNISIDLSNKRYILLIALCLVGVWMNIQFIMKFITSGFDISMIYILMAQTVSGDATELTDLYSSSNIVIQQYLGYPLLYTIIPISISKYIEEKKKKYLWMAIILFLIRFLFDIRRTVIVILAVFLIFYLYIRRKEKGLNRREYGLFKWFKRLSFKKKIFVLVPVVFLLLTFSLLSAIRSGDDGGDYSLFSNFYFYYAASLAYFSERLNMLSNLEYTFGLTSFRGLFAPFFAIAEMIGFGKPYLMSVANDNVDSLHATILEISPQGTFNSYATSFFEFYLDGGVMGLIIISVIFGYISNLLYRKMVFYKTERYMWKYSYWVSIFIYLSVLHFNAVVVCYVWPFVIERIFYTKQRRSLIHSSIK